MKLVVSNLLLFLTLLLGGSGMAQENVFLDRSYWKANPSLEQVKKDIAAGNDATQLNYNAFDAVTWALIEKADNEIVKHLLTLEGNGVNKLTHDGRTYIFWAAYKDNLSMMNYLLKKGAKTDIIDSHGYSVLNFAAVTGQQNTKLYDFILKYGGDPLTETNNDGANALLLVAPFLKDEKLIDYFVSKGVDINSVDTHGNGLFQYAAKGGSIPFLESLIAKGLPYKNFNQNGGNAMIMASQGTRGKKNPLEVYQFLESQGVAVKVTGASGRNPLHNIAYENEDIELFDFFIQRGVDVNLQDDNGNSPFMNAAYRNNLAVVKHLLPQVKNINAQDEKGRTALMNAMQRNTPEVASFLIEKGASTNHIDKEGNTITYYWINSFRGNTIEAFDAKHLLLVAQKVDFTKLQKGGNTLMHVAAKENNLKLLQKIATLGININAKNDEGYTALHIAAMKANQDETLKYLLAQGADATIKTDFEESVLDLASENELLKKNEVSLTFLNQ